MDLSAEEQGIPGPDESLANDLSATNGKVTNGENVSSTDHQFQKAISAWRSMSKYLLSTKLANFVEQLI